MPRCFWCNDDPLYMAYHDEEWGVPQRDPDALFELLLLEGFQAGLSWITVLKKRERYREVLFGFDVQRVAQMSDAEIDELMLDPGIIRNRAKLNAARQNAQAWLELDDSTATSEVTTYTAQPPPDARRIFYRIREIGGP